MKKQLLTLGLLAMTAGTMNAQTLTTDASWCQTIEKVFAENGILAKATCDRNGNNKTLHLTIADKTRRYLVPADVNRADYSTTVLVVVEGLDYGPQWEGRQRRLTLRDWRGTSSISSSRPDDVWEDARDLSAVENAMHHAVNRCTRTSELSSRHIDQNLREGNRVLSLRCRVIDLQRGEQYEKSAQQQPTGSRQQPRVSKRMAYARIAMQLIDAETGEVVLNSDFYHEDYTYASSSTDPMDNVVNKIAIDISNKLNNMFPSTAPRQAIVGKVLQVETIKKDKAETVYIDRGTAHELQTNEEFTVYHQFNVGGQTGTTPIGKIKVKEIQGESLSLCKVSKGEKEILAAINAGEVLIIKQ